MIDQRRCIARTIKQIQIKIQRHVSVGLETTAYRLNKIIQGNHVCHCTYIVEVTYIRVSYNTATGQQNSVTMNWVSYNTATGQQNSVTMNNVM